MEDFRLVQTPFRSALGQSVALNNYSDEILLLKEKNIPVLIVFGKQDALINADYLDNAGLPTWNNKIYKIDGASHFVHIDQPAIFNTLLLDFATAIFI